MYVLMSLSCRSSLEIAATRILLSSSRISATMQTSYLIEMPLLSPRA
jgi:hypothetical protein